MSLLKNNHRRVQNLTPLEIWGFIIGRVLAAFGVGVLAMQYFPEVAAWVGVPCAVVGIILLVLAARGLARKAPNKDPTAG
jgi:hypothetical protein